MWLLSQVDIRKMPDHFGGLEFKDVTNLHPLGLIAVIVLGIAMWIVPRRWAIVPMLIIACFVSSVQKVAIINLDFSLLRIMVLFGVVRLLIHREYRGFVWKPLDTAIVLWAVSSIVIYMIREGSADALINRLGQSFDALGMYFLFRCLIRDWSDVDKIVLSCIIIGIPVAFFLIRIGPAEPVFRIWRGSRNYGGRKVFAARAFARDYRRVFLGFTDAFLPRCPPRTRSGLLSV
jgi:hypothetical protein